MSLTNKEKKEFEAAKKVLIYMSYEFFEKGDEIDFEFIDNVLCYARGANDMAREKDMEIKND